MLPPDQEQKINALIFSGTAENIELALQLAKGLGLEEPPLYQKLLKLLEDFGYYEQTQENVRYLLQKIKETGLTMRPDQSHSYYDKKTCFENLDWKILAPIVESLSIYAVDDDFYSSDYIYPSMGTVLTQLQDFTKIKYLYIDFAAFDEMDLPKSWYLPELLHFEYKYKALEFPIYEYAPNLNSLIINDLSSFKKGILLNLLPKFKHLKSLKIEILGQWSYPSSSWSPMYNEDFNVALDDILIEILPLKQLEHLILEAKTHYPEKFQLQTLLYKEFTHLKKLELIGAIVQL